MRPEVAFPIGVGSARADLAQRRWMQIEYPTVGLHQRRLSSPRGSSCAAATPSTRRSIRRARSRPIGLIVSGAVAISLARKARKAAIGTTMSLPIIAVRWIEWIDKKQPQILRQRLRMTAHRNSGTNGGLVVGWSWPTRKYRGFWDAKNKRRSFTAFRMTALWSRGMRAGSGSLVVGGLSVSSVLVNISMTAEIRQIR